MINCKKCGEIIDGTFGSGIFCSRKCSNSRTRSPETRAKQSTSIKKYFESLPPVERLNYHKVRQRVSGSPTMIRRSENQAKKRLTRITTSVFDVLSISDKRARIEIEQDGKCLMCGNTSEWCGKRLTFELDHINGDRTLETRENLRLVCPNCHSLTPTFRSKNNISKISDEQIIATMLISTSGYMVIKTLGLNTGSYERMRRIIRLHNVKLSYTI